MESWASIPSSPWVVLGAMTAARIHLSGYDWYAWASLSMKRRSLGFMSPKIIRPSLSLEYNTMFCPSVSCQNMIFDDRIMINPSNSCRSMLYDGSHLFYPSLSCQNKIFDDDDMLSLSSSCQIMFYDETIMLNRPGSCQDIVIWSQDHLQPFHYMSKYKSR